MTVIFSTAFRDESKTIAVLVGHLESYEQEGNPNISSGFRCEFLEIKFKYIVMEYID